MTPMCVNGGGPGSCCLVGGLILHLTAMSSIHDPMETASAHTSPPATDHDMINIDEPHDDNDSDASSDVSAGDYLRVRNFLFPPTASYLTTNGTFRVTSRAPSKGTSTSGGSSPSARRSRRRPSRVYISRGSA